MRKRGDGKRTEEGEEDDEEKEGGVSTEEIIDGGIEDGEEGDEGCEKKLKREDAVHFADETPANEQNEGTRRRKLGLS